MLRCATSLETDKPGSASESRARLGRGELKSSRRDSCAEPFKEKGLYGRHLEDLLRARNGVKTSPAQMQFGPPRAQMPRMRSQRPCFYELMFRRDDPASVVFDVLTLKGRDLRAAADRAQEES